MTTKNMTGFCGKLCLVLILVALSFMATGSLVAAASAKEQGKVFKWKLSNTLPANDISAQGCAVFCKMVNERSKGRLIIRPYWVNELCPVSENFDALSRGAFQMAGGSSTYWVGKDPYLHVVVGLPYAYADNYPLQLMAHRKYGLDQLTKEWYAKHNQYFLGYSPSGIHGLMSNKPLRTVADFKGLKARATGPQAMLLAKLGAAPLWLSGAEIPTAMRLGTIDATTWTLQAWSEMQMREYAKYYCLPPLGSMVVDMTVNMDAWKLLPDDLKKIVEWSYDDWAIYNMTHYNFVEQKQLNELQKKEPSRISMLAPEDQKILMKLSIEVWDEVAAKNPLAAEGVKRVKKMLRDVGKIE